MLDTTGGEADNNEDSASESSFGSLAVEATQWCRLGFQVEEDSQDHVERCAEQILQINNHAT